MADKYTSKITFIEVSEEVKKTLQGLSKTALRASGKVIRKKLQTEINNKHIHSNKFKNHIGTWALVERRTGQPQLQVGFYSRAKVLKKGKTPSHSSPHWLEFGTKPHTIKLRNNSHGMVYGEKWYGKEVQHKGQKANHILRDTVQNNIAEIRKAQEEYLSQLNKTLEEAGAKIHEGEEDESD